MTETVNLAEAKATLSELVRRAAAGETINIALRGKPVVQIGPLARTSKTVEIGLLRKLTDSMTSAPVDTDDTIRQWRDAERY